MLRPTIVAVAATLLTGVALEAQRFADFSGRWALVEASGQMPGDRPADWLTIYETRATTTVAGAAMPSALLALQIERHTGAETETKTIQIGIEGGTSAALGGGDRTTRSQWSTRWAQTHLVVWHLERTVSPEHTIDVETTEDWSIDEVGDLVIATRIRKTRQELVTSVVRYRRRQ